MENIEFSQNAIFLKIGDFKITNGVIDNLLKTISANKVGRHYQKVVRKDTDGVKWSFIAFKTQCRPTCFHKEAVIDNNWLEIRFAYLLLVEIDEFVIISKRYVSGLSDFISKFEPIDYEILANVFMNEQVALQKLGMRNLDTSKGAMHQKIVEAENLIDSFSSVGSNTYNLSQYRLISNNEIISISLNTLRISNLGGKNQLIGFIHWCKIVCAKIQSYVEHSTYMSIFATPIKFEKQRDKLTPSTLFFTRERLIADIESKIAHISFINKKEEIIIVPSYVRLLNILAKPFSIEHDRDGNFIIGKNTPNQIALKINKKSISLKSNVLSRCILTMGDGTEENLESYINRTQSFIVYFADSISRYNDRKLFKDNQLLGNIDSFLEIFQPLNELTRATSEKGTFTINSEDFSENSLFHIVEQKFKSKHDIFICDDLGTEWGDHIGLTPHSVSFYVSKHKKLGFSASAFQEVIGQAQKNLGTFTPIPKLLNDKESTWNRMYRNDGIQTRISRIRTGQSAIDAISMWQMAQRSANFTREMNIIIDFISKATLSDYLKKLQQGEDFPQKKEAVPMLWLISSLVNTCREQNVRIHIYCQP